MLAAGARIMIAAAAHCPWDKVWSNLGLAMAPLLLLSLLLRVATGNSLALVATRLALPLLLS
jgi:hypothetical protein